MKILNLGCGEAKITGADNVDVNKDTGAELVFDIREKFPLEDKSYDKVLLFHCIEHIEKKHHFHVFKEIHRVLKDEGLLYVSYPEFFIILQNWLDNKNADRNFWEATIYGRQAYPGDYHYCGIHTPYLCEELAGIGFKLEKYFPEPSQEHNTVVFCTKTDPLPTYEEVLYKEVFRP